MIGAVTVGFIGGFVEEYMTGGGVSRGTVAGFLAVLLGYNRGIISAVMTSLLTTPVIGSP